MTLDSKDVIPNEIIDITLKDVHEQSDVLKLVNFAPAGVNKWLSGSHTGAAAWGKLTDTLTNELTSSITSLQMDVNKMYVLLIVPKSVRELALPLVDKYFTAVLTEAMRDGIVAAYLNGNGVNQPIGLTYKLPNSDNAVVAKDVRTDVTDFQSGLGIIKTALANGGKRTVGKVYCIANPSTAYQYVEPALYVMTSTGRISTALTEVELIVDTNAPEGKAIFTIENAYTMGLRDVRVDEYKETKAIDDADLFIAKAYGNGRPDDDATAVIVDATKLEAYAYPTKAKTRTKATGSGEVTVQCHIRADVYAKMFGMYVDGYKEGVMVYGNLSRHEQFCMTELVEDEDGVQKLKAYPCCTLKEGISRSVDTNAEEVAEIELTISVDPDEDGVGMYEMICDTDETKALIDEWISAFDTSLVKATTAVSTASEG